MKTLYISDLDGTLLNEKAKITRYTWEKLNYLLKKNILFTVATARSHFSIKQIMGHLPIKLPVIESNGAMVTDFTTGKRLSVFSIESFTLLRLLERIDELNLFPFMSSIDKKGKEHLSYTHIANDGIKWLEEERKEFNDPRIEQVQYLRDRALATGEKVTSMTIIDRQIKLKYLMDFIDGHLLDHLKYYFFENQYSPHWYWLSIYNKKASKGNAIDEVIMHSGIDTNHIVCFGDQTNDISMFKRCDTGVAVANACDDLLGHADERCLSNIEDGVARYIEEQHSMCKYPNGK